MQESKIADCCSSHGQDSLNSEYLPMKAASPHEMKHVLQEKEIGKSFKLYERQNYGHNEEPFSDKSVDNISKNAATYRKDSIFSFIDSKINLQNRDVFFAKMFWLIILTLTLLITGKLNF